MDFSRCPGRRRRAPRAWPEAPLTNLAPVKKIALIANTASGSAGEADIPALARRLCGEAELLELPIERAGEAAGCGAERIVVAGGDGSLGPAAEAAAADGIPLGVVPAGTANDFAARMGLPEEIDEALTLAVTGTSTRKVDLARAGSRPFLNVASLGLAPAAADLAEEMKDSLGALAYAVGALRAATSEEPISCEVSCDGTPLHSGEAWQVMIGSTGAFGGGSRIDADADDGRLDVVVIEGGNRAALAKHAVGLRSGRVEQQSGVLNSRCSQISVSLAAPGDLNIDGEVVASADLGGTPLRFGVEARALDLVIG